MKRKKRKIEPRVPADFPAGYQLARTDPDGYHRYIRDHWAVGVTNCSLQRTRQP